jgi:hypothetical protein
MELANDPEDVGLVEDQMILAIDLDFGAAVFTDQHFVADFNGEEIGNVFALFVFSSAKCEHFSFLGFFFCGVGEEQSACGFFFAGGTFHEHATSKGCDFGCHSWCSLC